MTLGTAGGRGVAIAVLGIAGVLFSHWMIFLWVPTEATMGIIQRMPARSQVRRGGRL